MGGNIGLPILAQDPLPDGGVYVLELSSYQIDLTYIARLRGRGADQRHARPSRSLRRLRRLRRVQGAAVRDAARRRSSRCSAAPTSRRRRSTATQSAAPRRRAARSAPTRRACATRQPGWPRPARARTTCRTPPSPSAIAAELGLIRRADRRPASPPSAGLPHRMERLGDVRRRAVRQRQQGDQPGLDRAGAGGLPPDPSRASTGSSAACPRATTSTNARPHFGHVAAAYTIGEAGPRFAEILEPAMHVERCEMLCEAIQRAIAAAKPGDVVLLSPACASFDQFRDYEARGDSFRKLVAELTGSAEREPAGSPRSPPHDRRAPLYPAARRARAARAAQFPRSRKRAAARLVARDRPRAARAGAAADGDRRDRRSPPPRRRARGACRPGTASSTTCTSSGCTCAGSSLGVLRDARHLAGARATWSGAAAIVLSAAMLRRAAAGPADRQRGERRHALAQPRHALPAERVPQARLRGR